MKKRYLIPVVLFLAVGILVPSGEVAADCVDSSGDSRPCSSTEQFDICLGSAIDAAEQRTRGREPSLMRFIGFNIDVASCSMSYMLPFI